MEQHKHSVILFALKEWLENMAEDDLVKGKLSNAIDYYLLKLNGTTAELLKLSKELPALNLNWENVEDQYASNLMKMIKMLVHKQDKAARDY